MIDLILPAFNRPEYTEFCLERLGSIDHGAKIRPILVNSGSRRRTSDILDSWCRDVKSENIVDPIVIKMDRNRGFAAAINQGLQAATQDTICLLHNDTAVFKNWAAEMLLGFGDDDVAAVLPRTSYANEQGVCVQDKRDRFEAFKPPNKDRIEKAQVKKLILDTYPEGEDIFLRQLANPELPFTHFPDISTYCLMIRKSIIDLFPKFDEDFFPKGYEDKLWWRHIIREGYVCSIANKAYVHHFGNITTDGPGFCFPDIMRANETRFKEKCERIDFIALV